MAKQYPISRGGAQVTLTYEEENRARELAQRQLKGLSVNVARGLREQPEIQKRANYLYSQARRGAALAYTSSMENVKKLQEQKIKETTYYDPKTGGFMSASPEEAAKGGLRKVEVTSDNGETQVSYTPNVMDEIISQQSKQQTALPSPPEPKTQTKPDGIVTGPVRTEIEKGKFGLPTVGSLFTRSLEELSAKRQIARDTGAVATSFGIGFSKPFISTGYFGYKLATEPAGTVLKTGEGLYFTGKKAFFGEGLPEIERTIQTEPFFTTGYTAGTVTQAYLTGKAFKKIFGKTKPKKSDVRFLGEEQLKTEKGVITKVRYKTSTGDVGRATAVTEYGPTIDGKQYSQTVTLGKPQKFFIEFPTGRITEYGDDFLGIQKSIGTRGSYYFKTSGGGGIDIFAEKEGFLYGGKGVLFKEKDIFTKLPSGKLVSKPKDFIYAGKGFADDELAYSTGEVYSKETGKSAFEGLINKISGESSRVIQEGSGITKTTTSTGISQQAFLDLKATVKTATTKVTKTLPGSFESSLVGTAITNKLQPVKAAPATTAPTKQEVSPITSQKIISKTKTEQYSPQLSKQVSMQNQMKKQLSKQVSMQNQISKQKVGLKQITIPKTTTTTKQRSKQKLGLKQITIPKTTTTTKLKTISPFIPTPFIPTPQQTPDFQSLFLPKKKSRGKHKRRKAYQPSVSAYLLGVEASPKQIKKLKKQKYFTGGEIRPLFPKTKGKDINKFLLG